MRLLRAFVVIVVFVFATHGNAWAQAIGGSQLSGVVHDSSGGAIPGAEVTATKTDTGAIRTVFSGADGTYSLPNLPIGPYQLKVVLQGFNTYIREGIVRDQRDAGGRGDQRTADGHGEHLAGRDQEHWCRTGHR